VFRVKLANGGDFLFQCKDEVTRVYHVVEYSWSAVRVYSLNFG